VANLTPEIECITGKFLGANGETFDTIDIA